jgi:hypothetical protein
MCTPPPPEQRSWKVGLRNAFTNWDQPLPFRVKVSKTLQNVWIRVSTGSTCCGHDGEPGC